MTWVNIKLSLPVSKLLLSIALILCLMHGNWQGHLSKQKDKIAIWSEGKGLFGDLQNVFATEMDLVQFPYGSARPLPPTLGS